MPRKRQRVKRRNGNGRSRRPHLDFTNFGNYGTFTFTIASSIVADLGPDVDNKVKTFPIQRRMFSQDCTPDVPNVTSPTMSATPRRLIGISVCFDNRAEPVNFRAAAFLYPGSFVNEGESNDHIDVTHISKLEHWDTSTKQLVKSARINIPVGPEYVTGQMAAPAPSNPILDTLAIVYQNYVGTIRVISRWEMIAYPSMMSFVKAGTGTVDAIEDN